MKQNLIKKIMVIVTVGVFLVGCGNNTKKAETDNLITKEEVTKIALEDAGVTKEEAENIKIELKTSDDTKKYEINFNTEKLKFDYTIDATTGDILDSSGELKEMDTESKASPAGGEVLTEEKAKQIIADKIPGSTIDDVELKLETKDQTSIYKGTLTYNNAKNDFEMNAITGEILSWGQN